MNLKSALSALSIFTLLFLNSVPSMSADNKDDAKPPASTPAQTPNTATPVGTPPPNDTKSTQTNAGPIMANVPPTRTQNPISPTMYRDHLIQNMQIPMVVDKLVEQALDAYKKAVPEGLVLNGKSTSSKELWIDINFRYAQEKGYLKSSMKVEMENIIAKKLTEEEALQILAFLSTPVGRKYLQVLGPGSEFVNISRRPIDSARNHFFNAVAAPKK